MPSPPLPLVQSLSPRIAILTSEDVVHSCEANGCRGLEELLRPWEGGTERVSILSSTLTPTIHPTFPLRFVSFESVYTNPASSSPNPDIIVDLISSFVGAKKPDDEQHYPLTRSLLLSSRPLASHETFNHPVGILFAVSTATPDPLGTLNKLHAQSTGLAVQSVPWMDGSNVLRFYVVIHDVSSMGEDMAPAHELLANVKKAYGPHSTLLVINSQIERRIPPDSPDVSTHPTIPLPRPFTPDIVNPSALSQVYASALSSLTLSPMAAASASLGEKAVSDTPSTPTKPARRKLYGAKLTAEDTQRLAALVRELVVQSLVPWMEARVREWNEVYHSHRRGITGRLFGAGRKFFGSRPNSPAPGSTPTGYNAVKGYYPITAVEALSRRLADFAFMLRDYRFAGNVYDSLRRDFAQDRAMRYAAAATEMYGLCLLLSHNFFLPSSPPTLIPTPFTNLQHTEITSWLEQAVVAYHQRGPASQIQLDALRITVLYYEAWKAIGEWRGVGAALVKSAGEADEVPSAVLIEEAAAADVKGGKSAKGRRRRAFHLVLAARRYETAGLKTFSRRCLERASQIYRASPWTAAQDRIEYSLGRQAYTIGESDVAVEHFLRLLRREDTGVPGSQAGPLEDMALAYEQLAAHPEQLAASAERLQLPNPVFDVKSTRVVASSSGSGSSTSRDRWSVLEAQALSSWDRKGKKPMTLLPDEKKTVVGIDEPFTVELVATNPLNAPLTLTNLTVSFDPTDEVEVETIADLYLEPYETRWVSLSVTARKPTTLRLSKASFMFHRFFPCDQSLEKKGKRLQATKAQRLKPTYAEDTSLTIAVLPARARVEAELIGVPDVVYEGEAVEAELKIRNAGKVGVEDLRVIWSEYGMVRRKRVESDDTEHNDTSTSIPSLIDTNTSTILHAENVTEDETISIPIIFSGLRKGQTDLLGLITFSPRGDETAITEAVMVEHHVKVLPLTSLKASFKPLGGETPNYLVALEVTNTSSRTLQVDGIHGVSAAWTVNSPSELSDTPLLPNQTIRTILAVKQDKPATARLDLAQKNVISALGRLIQGQPPEEVSADLASTISLVGQPLLSSGKASYVTSRRADRLSRLGQSFPTIPTEALSRIFPLLEPLDLDIVVSYSLPSSSRKGFATLHSLRPAPEFSLVEGLRREVEAAIASGSKTTRTMYEETGRLRRVLMDSVLEGVMAREVDPMVVRLKVGESKRGAVEHDFANGACKIPIVFELQNRSPYLPTRFILKLPIPSTSTQNQEPSSVAQPHFIGNLSHRGTIVSGGIEQIHTEIWVHEASLVNLEGWELTVETGEADQEEWKARMNWSRRGGEKIVQVRQV
ncbi:hypothetical protein CI109_100974 [Kwoniella shandongensis]|uniref:TPPC8 first Ig-like domain-containing protein n=1 Tax=Kwoniella shandongensis TaxID=1734106 RepID=A0A5M6CA13_9TREE|nr:uncharacterized protein CI109_001442 [Kwoniella shandongensis]KAA5530039.1 hypothetical protein CI109_001442 [Kwoniella shandongensis]